MIIGICGFGYSGSGAVVDYLNESDRVCNVRRKEFCMAWMPDGLMDLEYHLCHQN